MNINELIVFESVSSGEFNSYTKLLRMYHKRLPNDFLDTLRREKKTELNLKQINYSFDSKRLVI